MTKMFNLLHTFHKRKIKIIIVKENENIKTTIIKKCFTDRTLYTVDLSSPFDLRPTLTDSF